MPLTSLDDWLQRISEIHPVGWDLGLERVGGVADHLDLRHPARQVVVVAGTNGKGSTCEFLTRFAAESGLRVGKATSPHLVRFNERIEVTGSEVPDGVIVEAFEEIDAARGDVSLTYFEFATLASLLVFKKSDLDLAVLEVGLGGRLDAMNIVEPDLTIITSIALDHQGWLGDTREAIAREKAGIMRAGVHCIVADPDPPRSLFEVADETGAKLEVLPAENHSDFEGVLPYDSYRAAKRASERLGIMTSEALATDIAATTTLPGRRSWLTGPCRILLDVAHNPAAAESLAGYLATLQAGGRVHALFGAYRDKDIEAVMAPFHGLVKTWHLTALEEERGESLDQLMDRSGIRNNDLVHSYAKIGDALEAIDGAVNENDLLVVFGSFPVVAAALQRYSH